MSANKAPWILHTGLLKGIPDAFSMQKFLSIFYTLHLLY